jgi:hypothetical protein
MAGVDREVAYPLKAADETYRPIRVNEKGVVSV